MIRTARLTLEPLTAAHVTAMFPLLSDPALYQYLDYPPPPSLEHLQRVYAQLERGTSPDGTERWLNWIVVADAPIGFVQATVYADGSANVAYLLGSAHWGHGYALEAVAAMLEQLDARTFFATVEEDNERSIRLLQRLGFRQSERNGTELRFVR